MLEIIQYKYEICFTKAKYILINISISNFNKEFLIYEYFNINNLQHQIDL